MNKPISLALLGGGILLLIYGFSASDSLSSDVSRLITGSPTDRTIWLLVGGAIMAIAGSLGLSRASQ